MFTGETEITETFNTHREGEKKLGILSNFRAGVTCRIHTVLQKANHYISKHIYRIILP